MESFLEAIIYPLIYGYCLIALMMGFVYWMSRLLKNAGIVDVFWGFGGSMLATLYFYISDGDLARKLVIILMVFMASFRLGFYILNRFLKEHPHEDARYTAFKKAWGERAEIMTFWVFQFQGVLMVTVSLPILLIMQNPAPEIDIAEWLCVGLFLISWLLEAVADAQLAGFKSNPDNKGKTCQVGLWYYSRHPNYFFEWMIWVSYALFALSAPWGWLGQIAPVLMLHFLINVTGVKATEERALVSRSDYAAYQQSTSAFVPWFKKVEG